MQNPYRAPEANVAPDPSGADYQPQLFSASGRIGRLRYLAYGIFLSMAVLAAALCALLALALVNLFSSPTDLFLGDIVGGGAVGRRRHRIGQAAPQRHQPQQA